MLQKQTARVGFAFLIGTVLLACSDGETPPTQTESPPQQQAPGAEGTLQVYANGEDFVRQGFVSKDGWQIDFEHVYVTLADVTAYQTDPPYEAGPDSEPQMQQTVSLVDQKTVDLAAGDDNADPILVSEVQAPPGHYNALSWSMIPTANGPAEGYSLVLSGQATKNGQTMDFSLQFDQEMAFTCGAFVGDERKGILQPGSTADLEATFHFDHLFGDGEAAPDDEINTGALGFDPFAAIAQGNELNTDMTALEDQLSAAEYDQLKALLPDLAHVGEGHCQAMPITS